MATLPNACAFTVSNTPGTGSGFTIAAVASGPYRIPRAAEDGAEAFLFVREGDTWEICASVYDHATTTWSRGTLTDSSGASVARQTFTSACIVHVIGLEAGEVSGLRGLALRRDALGAAQAVQVDGVDWVSEHELLLPSLHTGNADFGITSWTSTYHDVVDEVWAIGYNISDDHVDSHPALSIRMETDYRAVSHGEVVKTNEVYIQFNGPNALVDGDTDACQIRPWFFSFAPEDETFGRAGELLYGFLEAGNYRVADGGGLTIQSGGEPDPYQMLSVDVDGVHVRHGLFAQVADPAAIASATTGANCQITFDAAHEFAPGSNITVFSRESGIWEPLVTWNITSTAGLTVTTDGDNTGAAYIPASPDAGIYGARYPHAQLSEPQVVAANLGVGRAVTSGSIGKFQVAGSSRFYGKLYITAPTAEATGFASARIAYSQTVSEFQSISFSNTSSQYSFGYLDGNNTVFAIGPAQWTDSSFTSSNSIATFNATGKSVGIGGSTANNGSILRIAGGTSSRSGICINNQTDGNDAPTMSGGVVLYAKAGKLYAKDSAGNVVQLTP